jgi:hypothetical protein
MIKIIYKITDLPIEICENIYLNIVNNYSQVSKVKVLDFYSNNKFIVKNIIPTLDVSLIEEELFFKKTLNQYIFKHHYLSYLDNFFKKYKILYYLQINNYLKIYNIDFFIKTGDIKLIEAYFNKYKYISTYQISLSLHYNQIDSFFFIYKLFKTFNNFDFWISNIDYIVFFKNYKTSILIKWINDNMYLDYNDFFFKPKLLKKY